MGKGLDVSAAQRARVPILAARNCDWQSTDVSRLRFATSLHGEDTSRYTSHRAGSRVLTQVQSELRAAGPLTRAQGPRGAMTQPSNSRSVAFRVTPDNKHGLAQ